MSVPRQELAAERADLRRERVAFETDHHRIEGSLVLPKEGYRSRLSDYLGLVAKQHEGPATVM